MEGKTRIANPLYDVVFRYLMEDNKVAKLFLSAIIGEQIEELSFNPTTHSSKIGESASITVITMDFSAKIKQENGEEKVIIIELQKAKFYHQTMRFRRYLGRQYQNPENINENNEALPIYPIYILGEAFTESKMPVIKIQRNYIDAATQEIIEQKHPFIEALTHDAIIIQIPYLKNRRQTILEQFLSIFDQSKRVDSSGHILALEEESYPEKYHKVIRRLNKALQSPNIEEDMIIEDEVISEFNKKDEQIEQERKARLAAIQQAEQARKQTEIAKKTLIEQLYKFGQMPAEIAQVAGISESEVKKILGL